MVRAAPGSGSFLFLLGWVISQVNEWEEYSCYLGEEVGICWNWATARLLTFVAGLGTVRVSLWFVSFGLLLCYNERALGLKVEWKSTPPLILACLIRISLCCAQGLGHSFKGYVYPFSSCFIGT